MSKEFGASIAHHEAVPAEALTLFERYGMLLDDLGTFLAEEAAEERGKGNDSAADGRDAQAHALKEFTRVLLTACKAAEAERISTGLYSVQRQGNGWAIYTGRDAHHHGANWGHLSECNAALAKAIERGLNAVAIEDAGETVPDCESCAGSGAGSRPGEVCQTCDGTGVEDRLLPALAICNRYGSIAEMAYLLRLVPRGAVVPQQIVAAVGRQFDAAMAAANPARPDDKNALASSEEIRGLLKQAVQAIELGDKAGIAMNVEGLKRRIRNLASEPVHYGVAAALGGLRTRLETMIAESVASSNTMSGLGFAEQAAEHRAKARAYESVVSWLDAATAQARQHQAGAQEPRRESNLVITLCGSARFEALFKGWNEALTICGHTVFTLTAFPGDKGSKEWYSVAVKREMDEAHLRKIAASDAIFVINRFGYIGKSTQAEIEHARRLGKPVYFAESWGQGLGICDMHQERIRALCEAFGLGRFTFSPIDTTTRTPGNRNPLGGVLLSHPLRAQALSVVERAELAGPVGMDLTKEAP